MQLSPTTRSLHSKPQLLAPGALLDGLEWNLESFSTLQDLPKESIIHVAAPVVTIYVSSFEAVFTNQALQLLGSNVGSSGW